MKPKVLFFARDYQADFFVFLKSDLYESLLVTLTKSEKRRIQNAGCEVVACFEEEFDQLPIAKFSPDYLETSYLSDRYLRHASVFERDEILGKEVSFWQGIFEKHKPAMVVNETIAIEISEVLYIESKRRNIEYISWMSFPIKNHFYWQSTPMHNSLDQDVFNPVPDESARKKAELYMDQVKAGAGKPFYAQNVRSRYSLYALAKNIYWYFRCILTEHSYKGKGKNLAIFGDNSSFYLENLKATFCSIFYGYDDLEAYQHYEKVFYPLHYEPEAVLFYMSEFYSNQLATIENIAKCLPQNQVLVVKEHPQQAGYLLLKRYRDLKKRVPNVVFIPAEVSTSHLLNKCTATVTLGSTAGLEGLVLGKPVIVLGRIFYDKYENVNRVETYEELRRLLRNASELKRPDRESLKDYLAKVISHCVPGNPFNHEGLYSTENIGHIVSAIETQLKRQHV